VLILGLVIVLAIVVLVTGLIAVRLFGLIAAAMRFLGVALTAELRLGDNFATILLIITIFLAVLILGLTTVTVVFFFIEEGTVIILSPAHTNVQLCIVGPRRYAQGLAEVFLIHVVVFAIVVLVTGLSAVRLFGLTAAAMRFQGVALAAELRLGDNFAAVLVVITIPYAVVILGLIRVAMIYFFLLSDTVHTDLLVDLDTSAIGVACVWCVLAGFACFITGINSASIGVVAVGRRTWLTHVIPTGLLAVTEQTIVTVSISEAAVRDRRLHTAC
jgi:hypothetical protein